MSETSETSEYVNVDELFENLNNSVTDWNKFVDAIEAIKKFNISDHDCSFGMSMWMSDDSLYWLRESENLDPKVEFRLHMVKDMDELFEYTSIYKNNQIKAFRQSSGIPDDLVNVIASHYLNEFDICQKEEKCVNYFTSQNRHLIRVKCQKRVKPFIKKILYPEPIDSSSGYIDELDNYSDFSTLSNFS